LFGLIKGRKNGLKTTYGKIFGLGERSPRY
jgi:hypothetical protein